MSTARAARGGSEQRGAARTRAGLESCEDVKVHDLDGDGRLDLIAAGRATNNLKVYWNRGVRR